MIQRFRSHKPNDEASSPTNSNGIAVCQDNTYSPNHESKLSLGPKGVLGTPSSWKTSQSRSDFRDAETLCSAVSPDSTQYWEGMLATLFDAGGSSSPSVYVSYRLGLTTTQ